MSRVVITLVSIVSTVILAGGCADDGPVTPDRTAERGEEVAGSTSGPPVIHPLQRFSIDVTAEGSFKPNTPLSIAVTATGVDVPTDDGRLLVLAPEVAAARKTGWDESFRLFPEGEFTPLVDESLTLATLQSRSVRRTVTVPEPGVYGIIAQAIAGPGEPRSVDGHLVLGVARKDVWLHVTETGGGVHKEFPVHLIPEGMSRQPGPFRRVKKRPVGDAGADGRGLDAAGQATTIIEVKYFPDESTTPVPVPNARVDVTLINAISGNWGGDYTVETDANGRADIGCAGQEWEFEADIRATISSHDVQVGTSDVIGTESGDFWSCDLGQEDVYSIAAGAVMAHVFVNYQGIIPASQSLTGENIGFTTMRIVSSGLSRYLGSVIEISTDPDADAIWGSHGRFIQAHEYGHAVHNRGLGIVVSNPNCPDPHPHGALTNLRCAYIEGYGNYHGVVTDQGPALESLYESGSWVNPGQDGAIIEGGVGAFMLDLTDPANDDPVEIPGPSLSDLIRTCQVLAGSWVKARGIDDLVYCLENEVDPVVSSTYFQTRSTVATDQSHMAGVLAPQDTIRATWLQNLYP